MRPPAIAAVHPGFTFIAIFIAIFPAICFNEP